MNNIIIKGARQNNLKNVDLVIPRNKLVCFVGVSGSGKSTLVFDIIAKEGARQYFESLPSFSRRYLSRSNQPDVDEISGVSATIVISQDRVKGNPRSTVGTLTEAYTYLRMLYSRLGLPSMDSSYYSFNHPNGYCKTCKGLGRTIQVQLNKIIDVAKSLNEGALVPSEWYVGGRQWSIIKASRCFDLDKKLAKYSTQELDELLYAKPRTLEAHSGELVDRFTFQGIVHRMMHRNTKIHRGPSDGDLKYFDFVDCPNCFGFRLNEKALAVKLHDINIGEAAHMPISDCAKFVQCFTHPFAQAMKPQLSQQLDNLCNVGLGYLSLNRSADTLSGGEAQRVKMARQLGCNLIETVYVLDEPTAGLHPRDVAQVVENLQKLRDKGNSVLVVEHDETVMRSADYLIEAGPGGGKNGGNIVAVGSPMELMSNKASLTGAYLTGAKSIKYKGQIRKPPGFLIMKNLTKHNLKNLTVKIPLGVMTALTGVSGSGKSSLVEEIVSRHTDKIVVIGQHEIGANKRGCIATYVGAFDLIRTLFAKENKVSASLFSYNSIGGCKHCKGLGTINMDMNFLGDINIKCEACKGLCYQQHVLDYRYIGKNIADVLTMTATEAMELFDVPEIKAQMSLLEEVGLGYLELGQSLDTLSGGEAQRLKLASKLQQIGEFYILDEPTSGLHSADVKKLLQILNRLVENGNTVLVVEHNLDVIKNADWIIDLGPEGGEKGGYIVAEGTPEEIAKNMKSYTGKYLKLTTRG
ncbi:daunorubicin resistance protein DrrC [Candidatus Dojkabacteria bacterium CG_4_9_14_3_um_filter_150_Dojkabacteria_WS6_41_13]|uniref:UvrABC system protein A n=1 Tax=Candidatus Dojkabacteria bacterium CG_4_10_14_0_2_um_filter_Dojkabacteria_WS6_41_15 TaxID=2014249 RepID=A0A2M7W0I5_9BACT|nr:MAG: daunorubicin resistance protein DrrC [Candidatus Dojkabacteria bacterium CG_4_10_14_0_2_um_filter_Dojkabacteria_WS6_41_15]PJB22767.1 MAG: daunorubicin resistance protein DrrC [Candidatus Dojkabacteria bacterium CG_4_9_14_3_um_filter_150_Dojkabacteria_WS6_41_13]